MKTRKYFFILLFLSLIFSQKIYSQCDSCIFKNDELWLLIKNVQLKNDTGAMTNDDELNIVLERNNINNIYKVFPYSKDTILKKLYKIYFNSNIDIIISDLESCNNIEKIIKRPKTEMIELYEPSDYMWHI
ncbi:MAG: hypothetical protein ACOX4D_04250 [Bacteroidales bacterium]|jgi:hypothetical protein